MSYCNSLVFLCLIIIRKILIADDNEYIRNTLTRQIRSVNSSIIIIECEDGISALESIKKRHKDIDLAFIDNIMPKMGGIELIQTVRQFENKYGLSQLQLLCKSNSYHFISLKWR